MMINAGVGLAISMWLANQLGAFVRAAVEKSRDRTVVGTADDDLAITNENHFEIAWLGDLGPEGEVTPNRALKYFGLFALVDSLIDEYRVRNPAEIRRRPIQVVDDVPLPLGKSLSKQDYHIKHHIKPKSHSRGTNSPLMSRKGHLWTAPDWQGFLGVDAELVGCGHLFGLLTRCV